jgi:hypothetical protein
MCPIYPLHRKEQIPQVTKYLGQETGARGEDSDAGGRSQQETETRVI